MDRLQYNNKALVGNWYEDRLDSSTAPIPELERTGKYRNTPIKMLPVQTPDLYVTSNQAFYTPQVPLVVPPAVQFSKATLATALHDRRPPEGSRPYGFGSTLHKHTPGHDARFHQTTTHSTFGGKYADSEEKRAEVTDDPGRLQMQLSRPAGKVFNTHGSASGIRTGGSTDERLQLGDSDPKAHTFIQRQWIGHDSHQTYVLNAQQYADQKATQNVPGLALKGLGEQDQIDRVTQDHGRKFYKKNDTLKRDTGIWNE